MLAGGLVSALLILVAAFSYMERRVLGRFQTRLGPNRVGPFGVLQPFADILKLILKEDIRPRAADRLTFFLAPIVMVVPILIVMRHGVIAREERYLERKFGAEYLDYEASVRRWV